MGERQLFYMLPPSVACGDSALPERANKALLILTPASCALAGGLFAGLGAGGLGGGKFLLLEIKNT